MAHPDRTHEGNMIDSALNKAMPSMGAAVIAGANTKDGVCPGCKRALRVLRGRCAMRCKKCGEQWVQEA